MAVNLSSLLFDVDEEDQQLEEPSRFDWNDSLLVDAYNRTDEHERRLAEEQAKKKEAATIKEKFPVGRYCRALYSGDACYYEGKVIKLNEYTCEVEFIGYKNREEVDLKVLKPSRGKKARKNQTKIANQTYAMNLTYAAEGRETDYGRRHEYDFPSGAGAAANNFNVPAACCAPLEVPQNMACLPPPPEPPLPPPSVMCNPSMSALLMSWYMAGYYTGLYQNVKGTECCAKPRRHARH